MRVTASTAGRAGRGLRGRRAPALRRAVAPRGDALDLRPAGAGELPLPRRRARRPTGPRPTSSTSWSRRSASKVGDSRVLCALSGGVDSSVAAALVQKAVGDQLTCVFVDHGLLRAGEAEQVEKEFVAATGVDLVVVDAREQFLVRAGRGLATPRRSARSSAASSSASSSRRRATSSAPAATPSTRSSSSSRARSTPTSSSPVAAPARPTSSPTTTSAGCPTTCSSSWSSRCARCSRTRCARSASSSACPRRSSGASRSPGPGSASASSATVTAERLEILRAADAIARARADRGRARPRHLAVPGRAARRRPLGGRAG